MDIAFNSQNLRTVLSVQDLTDKTRARYHMALEYGLSAAEALNLLYTYENLDEAVFIEYLKITLEVAGRSQA